MSGTPCRFPSVRSMLAVLSEARRLTSSDGACGNGAAGTAGGGDARGRTGAVDEALPRGGTDRRAGDRTRAGARTGDHAPLVSDARDAARRAAGRAGRAAAA